MLTCFLTTWIFLERKISTNHSEAQIGTDSCVCCLYFTQCSLSRDRYDTLHLFGNSWFWIFTLQVLKKPKALPERKREHIISQNELATKHCRVGNMEQTRNPLKKHPKIKLVFSEFPGPIHCLQRPTASRATKQILVRNSRRSCRNCK